MGWSVSGPEYGKRQLTAPLPHVECAIAVHDRKGVTDAHLPHGRSYARTVHPFRTTIRQYNYTPHRPLQSRAANRPTTRSAGTAPKNRESGQPIMSRVSLSTNTESGPTTTGPQW
jgi:hypothetical protein